MKAGFSLSASDASLYKMNAIKFAYDLYNKNNVFQVCNASENDFTFWVGDNIDHNSHTLVEDGGFHEMGAIAISNRENK